MEKVSFFSVDNITFAVLKSDSLKMQNKEEYRVLLVSLSLPTLLFHYFNPLKYSYL